MAKETLEAREGFVGRLNDKTEVIFRRGDLVRADDPAVKKWPHLFGPPKIEEQSAPPEEAA